MSIGTTEAAEIVSQSTEQPRSESPAKKPASKLIESIRLDFATIRIIILTAFGVVTLLAIPLFFVLRNFVTFDALDRYLKVTEAVRPKILRDISEEAGGTPLSRWNLPGWVADFIP